VFLLINFYFTHTKIVPDTEGIFREGVVGQPRFISPLYLSDNDVDRDIVELIYSGLLKYDENGKIVNDLAKDYQVKEEGKVYEFTLKDNLRWSDGAPLTSDDVIFTVNLVQSPQYKSPLMAEWFGVSPEKEGNQKLVFRLKEKYSSFPETVAHLKIIPKHIFQDISPESLPWILTKKEYLVGSGPFKVKELKDVNPLSLSEIRLERNENYYGKKPYLKEFIFHFYKSFDELLAAARIGEVDAFSVTQPKYLELLKKEGFLAKKILMPRYFALFFNLKNTKLFDSLKIREALSYAVDKEQILDKVFNNEGETVNSPILADYYEIEPPDNVIATNIEKAKELLEEEGFKVNPETGKREKLVKKKLPPLFKRDLVKGDSGNDVRKLQECLAKDKEVYPEGEITGYFGQKTKQAVIRFQEKYKSEILKPIGLSKGTGKVGGMTRDKLNEICQNSPEEIIPLRFTITTTDKFPLSEIAEVLKEQFEKIGAEVEVRKVSLSEFQTEILPKRNFEALLFGEALGAFPDPFPFWHSSQKDYPGLNITGYSSKKADKLLEKAREAQDAEKREEYLNDFQNTLLQDLPAIFLVKGDYFYFFNPKVKGYSVKKIIEPSKRLTGITGIYLKTKRVWK
jgi:ABC-type transport system substrate-binding protein